MTKFSRVISLLAVFILCDTGLAQTLEEQRSLYKQAKKELRAGRIDSFNSIAEQLKDYPLYPYLRYDYLSRNIWKAQTEEMVNFLNEYADVPVSWDLRRSWLNYLAKRGSWKTFVDHYTPQSNEELQCKYLLGRVKLNRQSYLLEDARTMWLSATSRPPECDSAFELLYKSELMTPELIWERIRLAMAEGQTRLAGFLARKLNGHDQQWVQRWISMHSNPWQGTSNPKYSDEDIAREIIVHGIKRLATRDIKKAMQRWPDLKSKYNFNADEIFDVESLLAIRSVRYEHPDAIAMLSQLDNSKIDDQLLQARISSALKIEDWGLLLQWTSGDPPQENLSQRWYYWQARALEETGETQAANEIYKELSKERDYFGFSAFDRLGLDYQMGHKDLTTDETSIERVGGLKAVERARELFHLGSYYSARREWTNNLSKLSAYDMQIAAYLAAQWGWHDRTILTLGRAQAYDDLELRFPMPFKDTLIDYADKRQLDRSWVLMTPDTNTHLPGTACEPAMFQGSFIQGTATGRMAECTDMEAITCRVGADMLVTASYFSRFRHTGNQVSAQVAEQSLATVLS